MISSRFLAFVVVGGVAALVNFSSRILLGPLLGYVPSIVFAYCIGMLTAFVLNRMFVFKDAGNGIRHQALWFTLVNIAAVLQTVLISVCLARWVFPSIGMDFHPETLAHATGILVPVFTSYVGHKRLTFRRTKKHPD
jgi:putative flippase GtrA